MTLINKDIPADEDLIKAIKQNDPEAFRQLYYKYHKNLFRFAEYQIHSAEQTKDLIQETFLRIWIIREKLDPGKSIKAYLYKSLSNLIINQGKLHSSHNISLEKVGSEGKIKDAADSEINMDMQNAVNNLPEKLRMVFLLSRIEGYKYDEIAEICSISIKAVEKRMSHAFEILRKIFTRKYFDTQ